MTDKPCFIYFVGYDNFVKIGHTMHLERRLVDLQCANPNTLELFLVIHYDSRKKAIKDERRLHTTYKKFRTRGEWFEGIDLANEWSQIHALTYAAEKYDKHIETNEIGRMYNNSPQKQPFPHDVEIPKQEIPFSDAKSSRNSGEVIYYLLFSDPSLRSGNKHDINDRLDFPVSALTIGKKRAVFKKYITQKIPDKHVSLMMYITKNPYEPRRSLVRKFNTTHEEVATCKEYAKLHKIARKYGQAYLYE